MKAGLFGSFSRGEQKPESDVDLIVQFNEKAYEEMDILDLIFIKEELENALNRSVDIMTFQSVSETFFNYIKKDLILFIDKKE